MIKIEAYDGKRRRLFVRTQSDAPKVCDMESDAEALARGLGEQLPLRTLMLLSDLLAAVIAGRLARGDKL